MKLYHGSTVIVKHPNIQKEETLQTSVKDFIQQPILSKQKMGFTQKE